MLLVNMIFICRSASTKDLYMWHGEATPSSLLIACNLRDFLSTHYRDLAKFENHSLCAQVWELQVGYGPIEFSFLLPLI